MDKVGADVVQSAVEGVNWPQRVGGLTKVPQVLAEYGVEPAQVLTAAGLPADALADPEARLPYANIVRMLVEASRRTECPHFGVVLGRIWRISDWGLLGELVRNSGTVREGLRAFVVNQRLNSGGGAAFLFEHGRSVSWGYAAFHPEVGRLAVTYDLVAALGVSVLRELCGPAWQPAEVLLPRHEPEDVAPYRRHFRCPIRFDSDAAALRFPARVMELPIAGADARRKAALEAEVARHGDDDLVPQLYRSLRLLLLDGATSGDRLAQEFDMHRRTLNRRLQAQGRTFQSVLDDVRFEVSRQLLGETRISVVEIAHSLGYAEASAFTRAFRRWAGRSPLAWRAEYGVAEVRRSVVKNRQDPRVGV